MQGIAGSELERLHRVGIGAETIPRSRTQCCAKFLPSAIDEGYIMPPWEDDTSRMISGSLTEEIPSNENPPSKDTYGYSSGPLDSYPKTKYASPVNCYTAHQTAKTATPRVL